MCCAPGLVIEGGVGALILIVLASEGVPWELRPKIIQYPGTRTLTFGWRFRSNWPPPLCVRETLRKRTADADAWVVAVKRTIVKRLIVVDACTLMVLPGEEAVGALVIAGRDAADPSALNRYGGL